MELKDFPFSRYGSMLAVSVGQRSDSLVIHDCRCSDRRSRVLSVKIGHSGHAVSDFQNKGSHVEIGGGIGRIWMIDDENLGLDIQGSQVLIEPIQNTPRVHVDEYAYWINNYSSEDPLYVHVRTLEGEVQRIGPTKPSSRNRIQIVVQLNYSDGRVSFPRPNFERQSWLTQMERKSFVDRWAPLRDDKVAAAAYTLWSNYIRKQGNFKFEAPLSSKVDGCYLNALDILIVSGALGNLDFDRPDSPLRGLLVDTREDVLLAQKWRVSDWGTEEDLALPVLPIFLESLLGERKLGAEDTDVVFRFLWKLTDAWVAKIGIAGLSEETSDEPAPLPHLPAGPVGKDLQEVSPLVVSLLLFQCDLMLKLGQELDRTFHMEVLLRLRERLMLMFGAYWRETLLPKIEELKTNPTAVVCSEALVTTLLARRFIDVPDSMVTEIFHRVLLPFGIESDCPRSRLIGEGSVSAVAPSYNFLIAWLLRDNGFEEESKELGRRLRRLIVDQEGGFYSTYSGTSGKGVGQPGSTATAAVALLVTGETGSPD